MTLRRSVLWAIFLSLVTSCVAAPRGRPENSYMGREGSSEMEKTEGNRSLSHALEIENLRTKRNEEGRLQVQFELRNKRASNLAIEWMVEWFDNANFQVGSTDHWTPVVIGGKGSVTLSITGPTKEASMWRPRVRPPNTVR